MRSRRRLRYVLSCGHTFVIHALKYAATRRKRSDNRKKSAPSKKMLNFLTVLCKI